MQLKLVVAKLKPTHVRHSQSKKKLPLTTCNSLMLMSLD